MPPQPEQQDERLKHVFAVVGEHDTKFAVIDPRGRSESAPLHVGRGGWCCFLDKAREADDEAAAHAHARALGAYPTAVQLEDAPGEREPDSSAPAGSPPT